MLIYSMCIYVSTIVLNHLIAFLGGGLEVSLEVSVHNTFFPLLFLSYLFFMFLPYLIIFLSFPLKTSSFN